MRSFFAIYWRELSACFLSPIAYVIGMLFFVGTSFTFLSSIVSNVGEVQSIIVLFIYSIMLWMPVLVTVVCMRLFAEEKRSGTIELLLTAPVSETQVVLGKYFGALTFILLLSLPVTVCLFIYKKMNPSIQLLDYGSLRGAILILLLSSCFFVSVGLMVSMLTKNQIIAAIGCFFILWISVLFGNILSSLPFPKMAVWGEIFSFISHIEEFSRGAIDTRILIQYPLGTWFILFLCVRILEMRRWL